MGVPLYEEESAELEFRKALYKHKFDRTWFKDFTKIENEHYAMMGAILEFTKGDTEDAFKINPLELSNTPADYKFEFDVPFAKELSEELMMMLCQRYRYLYGKNVSDLEVKHQRLLDRIYANIN